MAELSEFHRNKLLRVFTLMYDINNDGVIEWADFEICVEKIRSLHDWDQASKEHNEALATMQLIWDGLKKYADQNQDDKITKDEWCMMWRECTQHNSKGDKQMPEWQKRYMNFMFDVNDTSGDGFIDKSEYVCVYTSFGLSTENCEKAFDKFAKEGKISREQFHSLWKEYFLSGDEEANGNYIFGVLDFDY